MGLATPSKPALLGVFFNVFSPGFLGKSTWCKVLLEAVTSDGTQKWTMLKNPARMVESCPDSTDGGKDGNPLKGILRILALMFLADICLVFYGLRMVLFFFPRH